MKDDEKIFFKFAGDVAENVEDAHAVIRWGLLTGKETLLSTLVVPAWNQGSFGRTLAAPIVVKPMEVLREWDAAMAPVVVAAQCGDELVLPSGVELEELLQVLDYFQLAPNDGGASVNLSMCSIAEGVRARTFVADRTNFASALAHITAQLRKAVTMKTHFILRAQAHCLDTINSIAPSGVVYQDVAVLAPFGNPDRKKVDRHLSWSSTARYRDEMLTELARLGVIGVWYEEELTYFIPEPFGPQEAVPRSSRMWLLAVEVPPAEPKSKRRRVNSDAEGL